MLVEQGLPRDPRGDVLTGERQFKPDAPYTHPYYWAPFILLGNWL
jgi:CHAT domain-containing protein